MRSWLVIPTLVLALGLAACSDDDNDKDSGVPDQGTTADHALVDQGPGSDAVSPDQAAGDQGGGDDGTTAKKVEDYMPASNEISGWGEDTSKGTAGVEAGYTKEDIEALIDGKHDPYHAEGCDGFAMEYYKKDLGGGCQGSLTLYMWDMTTAAGAKNMFDKDKQDGENNAGLTFSTITGVVTEGIIAFDAIYTAFAHKGEFILQINAAPSDITACGTKLEDDVKLWAQTVTGKLP